MERKTIVIKYGGAAMNSAAISQRLMDQIAKLNATHQVVLVHGGGAEIDRWLTRLGIEPKKVQGLRVTDDATMEVVEMVLAGLVNKRLVGQLTRSGVQAIGLSGRDACIVSARKKQVPDIDLGRVGEVTGINAKLVKLLLADNYVPVICSIAEDIDGAPLNINADEIAAAIAVELMASALFFLSDIPGLMGRYPDPTTVISRLTPSEAEVLLHSGGVGSGMIPKIRACIDVAKHGVDAVHIMDGREPEILGKVISGELSAGTTIGACSGLQKSRAI